MSHQSWHSRLLQACGRGPARLAGAGAQPARLRSPASCHSGARMTVMVLPSMIGGALDQRNILQAGHDLLQHRSSQVRVSDLAPTENDRDLDLVAFWRNSAMVRVLNSRSWSLILGRSRMPLSSRHLLVLPGLALLLLLLVPELAVVNNTADGGNGGGRTQPSPDLPRTPGAGLRRLARRPAVDLPARSGAPHGHECVR